MDPKLTAMISLRSLAILFAAQGNIKAAESLSLVATGIQSGIDVDNHMRDILPVLESGGELPWDDVHARIMADGDRLQALATDTG